MASKNTFRFTRWCDVSSIWNTTDGTAGGTIVSSGSPDTVFQGVISLNQIPDTSDFTNLFSQFKITALEYHLINTYVTEISEPNNSATFVQNLTLGGGYRNTAVYIGAQNDTLGTTTIGQLQQEEGVVVRDLVNNGKPMILKIVKPTFNSASVSTTGSSLGTAIEMNGWLDTQSAGSVAYRGFFLGIQNAYSVSTAISTPATAQPMYTVRCRITLEFRGVR
jgi:hypothetical protein